MLVFYTKPWCSAMLPKVPDQKTQVKVYFIDETGKKYITRNSQHQVVITEDPSDITWTLQKKNVLHVEGYDPDHRNVELVDSYIIYYECDNKIYYLNIINDYRRRISKFQIAEGTRNYNRYLIVIEEDGKFKYAKDNVFVEAC
jgi:hypothetical protein